MERRQVGQDLQGFSETHVVGEDPGEAMFAEEPEPGHAGFLVGAQDGFERAEWGRVEVNLAALLGDALLPCWRRLNLPVGLAAQGGVEETGLNVIEAIGPRLLLRRAIEQDLLEFLDRAGIEQERFTVPEAGVALTAAEELLDVGGREAVAPAGLVIDVQVEPLFAGGGDLETGFEPVQVLFGGALEAFLEGHLPFPFEAGIVAGKEVQDGILAAELKQTARVGAAETSPQEAGKSGTFGIDVTGEIAGE